MIEYYVTLEASEDAKQEFQTDIARNGILVLRIEQENEGEIYHYTLQGDWNGYKYLGSLADRSYRILSLEHFEE